MIDVHDAEFEGAQKVGAKIGDAQLGLVKALVATVPNRDLTFVGEWPQKPEKDPTVLRPRGCARNQNELNTANRRTDPQKPSNVWKDHLLSPHGKVASSESLPHSERMKKCRASSIANSINATAAKLLSVQPFANRASSGLRPSKPSSVACQQPIYFSSNDGKWHS
jgi:hypothetical protein